MDRFVFSVSVVLMLMFLAVLRADAAAPSPPTLRIGILLDVEKKATLGFIRQLQSELTNLLKSRTTVSINPANILRCNWSADCIEKNYRALVKASEIDIIVGLGPLSSALLAHRPAYPKPVILVGVIDPKVQRIPVTGEGTSGVHNLTFVAFPQSLEAELETFHALYPHKRIALVEDRRLMELIPAQNLMAERLADKGIDVRPIAVDSLDSLFHQYPNADLCKFVNNPAAIKLAADFLAQEATQSLPVPEQDETLEMSKEGPFRCTG